MKLLVVILVVLALWSLWGYFSSKVEQAEYAVVRKADGYEVRAYASHIEAQTVVDGPYDEALSAGFRIVAGYIFGGNVKKEGIAMTAPVVASAKGNSRVIAFVMPKSYTMETLPIPIDSRVKLVAVPAKKTAVLRFSWIRSADRIQKKEAELLAALARDGVQATGTPSYAGYSAPWTPPWMMRNEVIVEIR
jgi:hypothetical protein